jgi:hypothetical protein
LCCTLCNWNACCEDMSSFLLNTCVVPSIVEHVKFTNTDTLHCKVPCSIWNTCLEFMYLKLLGILST